MYIAYAVPGINNVVYMLDMQCCVHIMLCTCWICGVVCIWHCAHILYVMLCTYGVMHMLDMQCLCIYDVMYMLDIQCYAHMLFYACCIYVAMYIGCCVHDCTSGTLRMWCCVHVVHVVLCTCRAFDAMYMWFCAHVMHLMLCTCDIVHML